MYEDFFKSAFFENQPTKNISEFVEKRKSIV